MKSRKKQINYSRFALSLLLTLGFMLIAFSTYAIFVSGPLISYNLQVEKMMNQITEGEEYLRIYQNVFRYETYILEKEKTYEIYDQQGGFVLERNKSELDFEKAIEIATNTYHLVEPSVEIGYGYTNGAYQLSDETTTLWLDLDSYEYVYYFAGDFN